MVRTNFFLDVQYLTRMTAMWLQPVMQTKNKIKKTWVVCNQQRPTTLMSLALQKTKMVAI